MNQDYTDIIQRLSQLLDQAIAEREVNLSDGIKQLDGEKRQTITFGRVTSDVNVVK